MPWTDMGTTDADIRHLADNAGIKNPALKQPSTSSGFTGLSVAVAAAEAARFRQMELPSLTLAVEGFGKVGSAVAKELHSMGVKLVAFSTSRGAVYERDGFNVDHLLKLYKEVGSDVVNAVAEGEKMDKAKLLELEVDILSPCAGPFSINKSNAGRIAARIVCPGANLPFSPEVQRALRERGVLCIPDFVANSGGVMGASMDSAGAGTEFTRQFINTRFARKVGELIRTADREGATMDDCARKLALQGFSRAKARGERSRAWMGLLAFLPHLYWSGLIPRALLRAASTRYFEKAVLLPNA
jgi:glutamate dehydrogenase (NAD(P)+)